MEGNRASHKTVQQIFNPFDPNFKGADNKKLGCRNLSSIGERGGGVERCKKKNLIECLNIQFNSSTPSSPRGGSNTPIDTSRLLSDV